jgi:hypothetical protein
MGARRRTEPTGHRSLLSTGAASLARFSPWWLSSHSLGPGIARGASRRAGRPERQRRRQNHNPNAVAYPDSLYQVFAKTRCVCRAIISSSSVGIAHALTRLAGLLSRGPLASLAR